MASEPNPSPTDPNQPGDLADADMQAIQALWRNQVTGPAAPGRPSQPN